MEHVGPWTTALGGIGAFLVIVIALIVSRRGRWTRLRFGFFLEREHDPGEPTGMTGEWPAPSDDEPTLVEPDRWKPPS